MGLGVNLIKTERDLQQYIEDWTEGQWNDINNKLPLDDEEIIYVVAYWPTDYFDEEESPTKEDLLLGFGYYYGNNHWKNDNWEKIIVKYWMEISEIP